MSRYSAVEQDAIRRALRPLEGILDPVELFDDIFDTIAAGSVGITALAGDVDSLALGGGHFSLDPDTTSGLTLGYKAGRFLSGLAVVNVAAGTILLSASATNYVEVSTGGTVSATTSGFTAGTLPLWTVTTGASSISVVTSKKTLLTAMGLASVVGSLLSTAGATKELHLTLGTLSATATFSVIAPAVATFLRRASLVNGSSIGASDTNYWSFGLVNKGAAGAGTTALVDTALAANTTKATGGSVITADVKRQLTLNGTPGVDAALNIASEDILTFTPAMTGSATNLTRLALRLDFGFTG